MWRWRWPTPRRSCASFVRGMDWPHGRVRLVGEGEGGEGEREGVEDASGVEGEDRWHVWMTGEHIVGERTMPLLRVFISSWGSDADGWHPRLRGISLSSNETREGTEFTFSQVVPVHSVMVWGGEGGRGGWEAVREGVRQVGGVFCAARGGMVAAAAHGEGERRWGG